MKLAFAFSTTWILSGSAIGHAYKFSKNEKHHVSCDSKNDSLLVVCSLIFISSSHCVQLCSTILSKLHFSRKQRKRSYFCHCSFAMLKSAHHIHFSLKTSRVRLLKQQLRCLQQSVLSAVHNGYKEARI